MTYRGTIRKGVVVLEAGVKLAEGTAVEVSPVQAAPATGEVAERPSAFELLKDLAGSVEGLPADAAENHDHYLYGTRKK
jgi:hypothetical protein